MNTLNRLGRSLSASTLTSNRHSETEQYVEEETGTWWYLVADSEGIRPRKEPKYTKETRQGKVGRFSEGTIVEVNRRRRLGWTRWLACASGEGWVFDISPKNNQVRLVEVGVTRGEWRYQVVGEGVAVMKKPLLGSPRASSKAGKTLEFRDIVVINERIRPFNSKGSFLRLADGRGYVLDFSQGRQNLQRMDLGLDLLADAPPAAPCIDAPVCSPTKGAEMDAARVRSLTAPLMENVYTKLMSRSSSSVVAQTPDAIMAAALADLGVPDYGRFSYIVLDPQGLTVRSAPTYDASTKTKHKLKEGEIVTVVERRSGTGTTFLRIEEPQGWVFDMQPSGGNNMRQRMMEVKVEQGKWLYRVCEDLPQGQVLRARCSFLAPSAVSHGCHVCQMGALVTATRRCQVGNTYFVYVEIDASAAGWIFDSKDGRRLLDGPLSFQNLGFAASVTMIGGARLHSSPTHCKWAMTETFLERGTIVRVECRGEVGGHSWAKVTSDGHPEGWVACDALEFETSRSWAR